MTMLDVSYDACIPDKYGDGIFESWYSLCYDGNCNHISHAETEIKYYFVEHANGDQSKTWEDLIKESSSEQISTEAALEIVLEVKNAYANSMKKWNSVYYYSYDSSGNVIKNKVINITEAINEQEANLLIYPTINYDSIATTTTFGFPSTTQNEGGVHSHYHLWKMVVNVERFFEHHSNDMYYDSASVQTIREATGAHEIGHLLGLQDIDANNLCNAYSNDVYDDENKEEFRHHHEVLMGYGQSIITRSVDITYKDIAGVAITRGFHTDNDHKWLLYDQPITGVYKLVCSICNGVKAVQNVLDYQVNIYGQCNNNHALSSGNMMAVASYGSKDYYKCKYCRYVAPFSDIVEHDYCYTSYSNSHHVVENIVQGLEYTFYENHAYGRYFLPNNKLTHWACCSCGDKISQRHVIDSSSVGNGSLNQWCKYCGEYLGLGSGTLNGVYTDYPHTENGSYILPNGIIVLVPDDEEAYFNGTLEFRTGEVM